MQYLTAKRNEWKEMAFLHDDTITVSFIEMGRLYLYLLLTWESSFSEDEMESGQSKIS
jgi:hypothetical protein